jgi:hypothetical protein
MSKNYSFTASNPPVLAGIVVKQHEDGCTYPETENRKHCTCWKYFYITPGRHRIAANTRAWDKAESLGQKWVEEHMPGVKRVKPITPKPILEVFDDFIAVRRAANLKKSTLKKITTIRNSMGKFLTKWNAEHVASERLTYMHELKIEHMRLFVESWDENMPTKNGREVQMAKTSKAGRRGYLRNVWDYAIQMGNVENTGEMVPSGVKAIPKSNPANFISVDGAKSRAKDKMPLSDDLWFALLAACDTYAARRKCQHTDPHLGQRAKTFWKLMYVTGFAITDAFLAQRSRLKINPKGHPKGYYFDVNRQKTGSEVFVKIDENFYRELVNVPPGMVKPHPDYFFWTKKGEPEKACSGMQSLWPELLKLIEPEILYAELGRDEHGDYIMPTPHCLRYNCVENLLEVGATVEQVALAIGDTVKVVQEHYMKRSAKRLRALHKLHDAVAEERKRKEQAARSGLANLPAAYPGDGIVTAQA